MPFFRKRRVIDLIKIMRPEELAAWLEAFRLESPQVCQFCENYRKDCPESENKSCIDAVTKYLMSELDEAKEDETDEED